MTVIKWILLNIVLLFTVHFYSQSLNKTNVISSNTEPSLRLVLEEIRMRTGINFVYDDNLVDNLRITGKIDSELSENYLRNLLNKFDIAYKIYPNKSYVLFKKKKLALKEDELSRAVVIRQTVPTMDSIHVFSIPKMMSNNELFYPPEAVKNNMEGRVTVRFLVDKEGNVVTTHILSTSGYPILDSSAANYLKKSKFFPALENGNPRDLWLNLKFRYMIRR